MQHNKGNSNFIKWVNEVGPNMYLIPNLNYISFMKHNTTIYNTILSKFVQISIV